MRWSGQTTFFYLSSEVLNQWLYIGLKPNTMYSTQLHFHLLNTPFQPSHFSWLTNAVLRLHKTQLYHSYLLVSILTRKYGYTGTARTSSMYSIQQCLWWPELINHKLNLSINLIFFHKFSMKILNCNFPQRDYFRDGFKFCGSIYGLPLLNIIVLVS